MKEVTSPVNPLKDYLEGSNDYPYTIICGLIKMHLEITGTDPLFLM